MLTFLLVAITDCSHYSSPPCIPSIEELPALLRLPARLLLSAARDHLILGHPSCPSFRCSESAKGAEGVPRQNVGTRRLDLLNLGEEELRELLFASYRLHGPKP